MVEYILIFGLGFVAAALVFLICLPLLWHRAVRLSTRRLEMQLPLSMTEIYAERDQIRARAAVDLRQLELKLADCEQQKAQFMTDIGMKMNEVALAHSEAQALRQRLERAERGVSASVGQDAQQLRAALSQMGHDVVALFQGLEKELGTEASRAAVQRAQKSMAHISSS